VLIGAMVFAVLILMLLFAERATGSMWSGGRGAGYFYCTRCDLRYPRREVAAGTALTCPRGHVAEPVVEEFSLGTLAIVGCTAFVLVGLILLAAGLVPVP
jgi:hypothetical protein